MAVTIDLATDKIYWGSYDTFKIRTGNLDGTGAHDLFTGENYPTGIVVDDAAGKIYWTNEFAGQIRVGNVDGTGARNLFAPKGGIGGLALDPGTGKLYWATSWTRRSTWVTRTARARHRACSATSQARGSWPCCELPRQRVLRT